MPWQECNRMDERLRFVARLLDGEKMAPLCREFGISRKTGYKIFNRYKEDGLRGLEDRPRRPLPAVVAAPFDGDPGLYQRDIPDPDFLSQQRDETNPDPGLPGRDNIRPPLRMCTSRSVRSRPGEKPIPSRPSILTSIPKAAVAAASS